MINNEFKREVTQRLQRNKFDQQADLHWIKEEHTCLLFKIACSYNNNNWFIYKVMIHRHSAIVITSLKHLVAHTN